MAEQKQLKIVPSGKVYRQKFEAEVMLVKALEESEEKRKSRDPTMLFSKEGTGIPLVKVSRQVTGTGMLTSRQKTWVDGFSNENHQENPVLYKFYAADKTVRNKVKSKDDMDVRGLPDIVVPSKTGSDIIDRIAESRRQRHETAVEEMHQELGLITSEIEPQIEELGAQLMAKLAENDKVLSTNMLEIEEDSDLMSFDMDRLQELWQAVADQSAVRQFWIKDLDGALDKLENDRMDRVRDIFSNYSETLEKISHISKPELQRVLDHETQLINQQVLSNRRACADLYARLMMADIEREKKLHLQWKRRCDDWRKLHTEKTVKEFVDYMESEDVVNPPATRELVEQMQTEQAKLNRKRLMLIDSLREFKPPSATKTNIYQWNQKVTELSKQIDKKNQFFFNELYKQCERVCQDCLERAELVKQRLTDARICTPHKAKLIVEERCLPRVGQRQARFEKDLEKMDKILEEHNCRLLNQLRSLFKYLQGVAHIWDLHELGLAKAERALQEKLDESRKQHDTENQDKEASLDIVMDRMRQDASEALLQQNLLKSLEMLETIKTAYYNFHDEQSSIVQTYPSMVEEELRRYDDLVCKFFSVQRNHPDDHQATAPPETAYFTEEKKKGKKKSSKKKGSKTSPRPKSQAELRELEIRKVLEEIISTARGTMFYVCSEAGPHEVPPEAVREMEHHEAVAHFLPEPSELEGHLKEGKELPEYIQNVDIPESHLIDVRKRVRMNFLDHLEEWTSQSEERSGAVVAAKCEELNSELDLRLHLHQPRARRAELDVHNVRAAELVMHSERVSRHCKGITQSLAEVKGKYQEMSLEHNKLAQKFRKDVEALETIFVSATKSTKLVALSTQLQAEQDKYMRTIRVSLRDFRKRLDDTLQMLRQSNAKFIRSFKIFSDGGNFCPEEIDDFRKKLDKMSQKIDSTEGSVMSDLEGIESKRLDQATKIANEFEDRFKNHMVDLVFMEKIGRWLTNTQVKVKAEVAESNTQAQRLAQMNFDIERRTDACLYPNLDKESVTPAQLYEGLQPVFQAFHERSVYLNCIKVLKVDEAPTEKPSAKVGFAAAADVGPLARGKVAPEDPSVSVIKSIIKTQKTRLGIDVEETEEKEKKPVGRRGVTTTTLQVPASHTGAQQSSEALDGGSDNPRDVSMSKSRMSHRSEAKSHISRKSGRSHTSNEPKRVQSGTTRGMFSKSKGIDKKYFIFGEYDEDGEETHFIGRTKRILREALDGLLSSAELYYRSKGSRPVTRPQALQETFEICADVVLTKLESYYKQADEYHNACLQEFRKQLDRLEDLLNDVPKCVVNEFLTQTKTSIDEDMRALRRQFQTQMQEWHDARKENNDQLRPSMGHPNADEEIRVLSEREAERHAAFAAGVDVHAKELQELVGRQGQEFVQKLATMTESMLRDFDAILTIDDVEKGRSIAAKHLTSELIRRKQSDQPLEDPDPGEKIERGRRTWKGLPKTEIVNPHAQVSREQLIKEKAARRGKDGKKREAPSNLTSSVTTAKTTVAHHAAVGARDEAYQDFKSYFESSLRQIETQKEDQTIEEQRWTDNWAKSIGKVQELFVFDK